MSSSSFSVDYIPLALVKLLCQEGYYVGVLSREGSDTGSLGKYCFNGYVMKGTKLTQVQRNWKIRQMIDLAPMDNKIVVLFDTVKRQVLSKEPIGQIPEFNPVKIEGNDMRNHLFYSMDVSIFSHYPIRNKV